MPLVKKASRHLVTSALPYANGPLHIGHLAGAFLPGDIYVKFLRQNGEDVLYVCGSDEHGAAITLRAKNEGITPKEIVDKYHELNKRVFESLEFDFDIYHRTSAPLHRETAQDFFLALDAKGVFTREVSEQFYDEEYQQFLADRYIIGTCPNCSHDKAFGDQCENCGTSLSPKELINPKSTLSGNPPVLKETEHYFLPMDQYQEWIEQWISKGVDDGVQQHDITEWKKNVLGQCLSWIRAGLKPRAMTRDLDWGVPVPKREAKGKVLYVWLDAPIGYISASKQWASDHGKDWEAYWKHESTRLVHFIGKDNIVFHCIIFPILLKAHGSYVLPQNVPANEFLNLEGDKISTSRNWAIWVHEYLEEFPDKKDELRYVLTSIAPETKDSEFTWGDFQARVNNELVAIYGNFINRGIVLTEKYFDGKIPAATLNKQDQSALASVKEFEKTTEDAILRFSFREAKDAMMNLAREGNRYLAEEEPWKTIKTDPERTATVLRVALEIAARLAIVSRSFVPESSARVCDSLGINHNWENLNTDFLLEEGRQLGELGLLFQKIEDSWVDAQRAKLQKPESKEEEVIVTFEEFQKMDLRLGTIQSAEKHPDADKLLVLQVAMGDETSTIVSGIAEHYDPQNIVGQQVCVLKNLAPKKIRGVESKGMILMAEDESGKLSFLQPDKPMPSGAEVR